MRPTFFRSAAQAVKNVEENILKKGAKKDPELWVTPPQPDLYHLN